MNVLISFAYCKKTFSQYILNSAGILPETEKILAKKR